MTVRERGNAEVVADIGQDSWGNALGGTFTDVLHMMFRCRVGKDFEDI